MSELTKPHTFGGSRFITKEEGEALDKVFLASIQKIEHPDIAILKQRVTDLEQQLKTANEIIDELCNDYEPEIKAKYEGTLNFPCRQRDYDADMDVINRARKCLAE